MSSEKAKEAAARAAYEVNRAYCIAIGDDSPKPWEQAPEWQRTSVRNGVDGVIAGNSPRQSHESWLREKVETGWMFGPLKDPEKKTHPCMVPYDLLPVEQQRKDDLYVGTVRGMLAALEGRQ